MEGMPRFPMFAPDFKQGCNSLEENGFQEKIFNYIRSHYGQDPNEFVADMEELNKIRTYCLLPFPSEDLIPIVKRYYAQLLLLSNQFPLDGKHPDLSFEWQWSDRLHDPNNVLILGDVQFELCNLLYNLACIHAQIGAEMPRDTDEGIKKAFTHFGYSAYPLQVLRDEMNASRFPTLDFDRDTISLYLNIIMGQAQECMVEKALVESRKPLVIARLTSHLHDIYSKCAEHLVHGPLGDVMNASRYKEWVRMCTIKSSVYGAISMLYQGMEAEENKKYGERVAYYDSALHQITTARNLCAKETRRAYLETVAFVDDVIVFKSQDAKKENDFIYHAKIPKPEEITMAEPLAMACAYSFNALDPSVAGAPLFNGLVPPSVVKACSEYDEKKAEVKRSVLEKVEAYDVELMQFLERLDLVTILKIIRNPCGSRAETESPSSFQLPEDLLASNSYFSVQNRDAVPEVLEQLRVIGEKARETDSLLTGLIVRLDAIPVADLPNKESAEGVRAIKDECTKLLEASSKAKATNMNLRLALNEKMEAIQTLGLSLEELVKTLAPQEHKDYASTPEGARMLQLGEKVDEMKRQRKSLIDKMHEEFQKDNINGRLLIERDTNHTELFEKELKKHDNLLNLLEQNLAAQQRILHALLEANADFAESGKELREQAETRNMRILDLIASSDEYFRVIAELEQAGLFYGKLEDRSRKISQAVETIENTFSDYFKNRNEAMASIEKKKADERAALDAASALEDFSIPSFPSLSSPIVPPQGGGGPPRRNPDGSSSRRRLGDYMAYYRDKMEGRTGVASPSTGLPSSSYPSGPSHSSHPPYVHSHHPVQSGPPLPSLSIPPSLSSLPPTSAASAAYAESSGAPSPAPSTVSNFSYAPPPSAAAAAFVHPQTQPTSKQQQYQMQQQQGFPRFGPGPAYSGGYGSQQQQPQQGYGPPPPSHAPYMLPPSQQPQHGFPPMNGTSSAHHIPPTQQPPMGVSSPYSPHPTSQSRAPSMAPPPTVSYPPPLPVHTVPTSTTVLPPPQTPAQQSFVPSSQQYPPPPLSVSPYLPPSAAAAASPFAAPPLPQMGSSPWMHNGAASRPYGQQGQAPPPPMQPQQRPTAQSSGQPASKPSQPTPPTPAAAPTTAKLPSLADLGAQLRSATMQPSLADGPSPWHRGVNGGQTMMGYGGGMAPSAQSSPWMQQQQKFPLTAAAAPPASQYAPPPHLQQQQPLQLQPRNETIDLLSDLFSCAPVGPAPLQPTGIAKENQVHTTHALSPVPTPPTTVTVAPMDTVSGGNGTAAAATSSTATVVRPAAAVMPMQQMSVQLQQGGGGGGGE
ncbi:hypothetical protein PENTCL1PPCAC_22415, partial [Pristionchus entomophagus]